MKKTKDQIVFAVQALSITTHDFALLGIFDSEEKAQAFVNQVEMPQRDCLHIHPWTLNTHTDEDFWQKGYKPEPPISDEERLNRMAASAADDAEREARETGKHFDREQFLTEYREKMAKLVAESEAADAERVKNMPKLMEELIEKLGKVE